MSFELPNCFLDKSWRVNNIYSIVDKQQQAVTFVRNEAQRHFNENKHTRNLILKARQLGMTTDEAIDSLDDIAFRPNFHVLFLAHIKEEAQRIFSRKIKYAWDKFKLKPFYKTVKNDAGTLELDFGASQDPQYDHAHSSIYVSNSGRSGTYARIHVTELAKMERINSGKAKEFISGTIPALPIDCRIDIESTAEGDYGLFYDMFNAAMERWEWLEKNGIDPLPTDWKPHFYNWTWDKAEIEKIPRIIPFSEMENSAYFSKLKDLHGLTDKEISYYYIKFLTLNRDLETLQQEYPTTWQEAFVASGGKFFPVERLSLQYTRKGLRLGDWTFYAAYNKKHRYVLGVDPSGGAGGDNAVIEVLDVNTGEQVAEFVSDSTKPDELAIEAVEYAKKFGNAIIVPEVNNHGLAFIVKCKELGYTNIYARTTYDKDTDKEKPELGFLTTRNTKPLILYALSFELGELGLLIYSDLALKELRSYPKSELDDMPRVTKATAKDGTGKHFDRVMALALANEGKKHVIGEVKTVKYSK
jgi:hypothetical protein